MSINTWPLEIIDWRLDLHYSVHRRPRCVCSFAYRYLNRCRSLHRDTDNET
ncbi:unnamed protein product [Hymenolepis diminuta]|uniref:Uncharacterized protein n=1 Tax=Hymenolepis diminuta TaxID=6216 RepID=A0A564YCH5_HYMDI|nr:unnamed protein product [Hymenolepis diminuta]